MLSVRQDLAAANPCFSFSSPPRTMNDGSNDIEFDAWTETIRGGPWNRGVARNYGYHGSPSSHGVGWLANDGESTVAPPPSGENAGSPTSQTNTMENYNDCQKHLCSNSRAQAISQYRQEMIDMVDDMPESIYELSLRDLAELPKIANAIQETPGKGKEDQILSAEEQKKAKKGMKRASRSGSMDNGAFLLKVLFPVSLGGRRKSSVTSRSSLPKPMLTDGEKGMLEKNMMASGGENELGYLSQNNGTNSRRRRKNGCYSFFQSSKNKN